jgi:hypothetical protein
MRSYHPGRAMSLALILMVGLASSGCPELNRQPDRSVNPLFSVDDPAGRERDSTTARPATVRTAEAQSAAPFVKTQSVSPGDVVR